MYPLFHKMIGHTFCLLVFIIPCFPGDKQKSDASDILAQVQRIEARYRQLRSMVVRQHRLDVAEAIDQLSGNDPARCARARSLLIRLGPACDIRQALAKKIERAEKNRLRLIDLLERMNSLQSDDDPRIKPLLHESIRNRNKEILFLCLWGQYDVLARQALSEFRIIGDAADLPAVLLALFAHSGPPLGGTEQEYCRIQLHQEYHAVLQKLTGLSLPAIEWRTAFNSPL